MRELYFSGALNTEKPSILRHGDKQAAKAAIDKAILLTTGFRYGCILTKIQRPSGLHHKIREEGFDLVVWQARGGI